MPGKKALALASVAQGRDRKENGMMEWWNNGVLQFAFGGTRSVASGHDEAWPSRGKQTYRRRIFLASENHEKHESNNARWSEAETIRRMSKAKR
jgi:hypothetical protein